jgi:toxin ParE1/3/4
VRYRILFRPAAEADLDAIDDFIARESPERAAEFVGRIRELCSRLASFPERGVPRDDLRRGLRTIALDRRVTVVFRIERRTVRIVRILYGGRDLTPETSGL